MVSTHRAAEPSFDCLIDMTKIFHCTLDDIRNSLFSCRTNNHKEVNAMNLAEASNLAKKTLSNQWVKWIHRGSAPANTATEKSINVIASSINPKSFL